MYIVLQLQWGSYINIISVTNGFTSLSVYCRQQWQMTHACTFIFTQCKIAWLRLYLRMHAKWNGYHAFKSIDQVSGTHKFICFWRSISRLPYETRDYHSTPLIVLLSRGSLGLVTTSTKSSWFYFLLSQHISANVRHQGSRMDQFTCLWGTSNLPYPSV